MEPMGSSVGCSLYCIFRLRGVRVADGKFGLLHEGKEVPIPWGLGVPFFCGVTWTKCFLSSRLETRTKESNMCASARRLDLPARNESKGFFGNCGRIFVFCSWKALSTDHAPTGKRFEWEHTCWDPKDGELCLSRTKPGETLVKVRSDSNVQIDRRTWV